MMNIYKRPLFRQAGGPAAPMATDMPAMAVIPPEMQAQVQQAEQSAAGEMEGYGRAYVDEMMTGLDGAESAEEVINAIRGNAQPIDSRYDELAGIVGIEDARATPESVLALVQPTMMMTEQGAMDTGIGELIQSLTGGVEMEDEQGMATPMGQGVGELMMGASAAEPMPVQQYNMGGPVVKMKLGGVPQDFLTQQSGFQAMTDFDPSAVRQSYEARAPLYEELLGDTENRRKQAQSSLFFDIAKAGLNLAGGVDPSTGQSMTAAPLGAQIARAAMPVAESAQRAGAEVTDAQRGARVAALQSAEAEQAARLAAVTGERQSVLQGQTEGSIQSRQQGFQAGESALGRELQRDLAQSAEDHNLEMQNLVNEAQVNLQNIKGDQEQASILARGDVQSILQSEASDDALTLLKEEGQIRQAFEQLSQEGRMALQKLVGVDAFKRLEFQVQAEKDLFTADSARRAAEIQMGHENQVEILGARQSHEMDQFTQSLDLQRERMDRTVGGADVFWGGADETAFDLARKAQEFAISDKTRQNYTNDEYQGLNSVLARERFEFEKQGYFTDTAMRMALMNNEAQIAALNSMQKSHYSFGDSLAGVTQNLISDPSLLSQYADGSLDQNNPNAFAIMNTAISTYMTPTSQYNAQTGQYETRIAPIPMQLRNALDARQQRNLTMPFANGGEVRKFQAGGPVQDYSRFNKILNNTDDMSITEQDIELPGRIIPETPNLTPGVGLSTLLNPVRTTMSYARELGVTDREAPFSEIADAQTQLTSLANVTQRFVRESVGGRALKDEVEALAAELGKPGISSEETTLEKLTNMRNQLLEVEDLATSILETPEKFTTAQVTTARQDVRRLSPLIENYDRAIMNFETALNPNKPDPAMFEGR